MTKKNRLGANRKCKEKVVLRRQSPEPQIHGDHEQNLVSTHDASRILPTSTQNGHIENAVLAGEGSSVHTDLRRHQNSAFFPSSTEFEVSGGKFCSYGDYHSTGNIVINVNGSGNDDSIVEIGKSGLSFQKNDLLHVASTLNVDDAHQTQQGRNSHPSRFSDQCEGEHNFSHKREERITLVPTTVEQRPPIGQATAHSPPPPPQVKRSSETYYRHLLASGYGSPLWIPEPSDTLPIEYQRAGVGIGDAIILTDFGGTDFLFNIYHPKGDSEESVNLAVMPDGYYPLERPNPRDVNSHVAFRNNGFVSSFFDLVRSQQDEQSLCLTFESTAKEGAILAMPNGANSKDLQNKIAFRKYIRINAERWYKYANEIRGRDARNGDILLVVGTTFSATWGMATFADRSEESAFRVKFKPTGKDKNEIGFTTYGWDSEIAEVKSGPYRWQVERLRSDDADGGDEQLKVYENQCLFVRTINVALQDDVWNKLRKDWEKLDLHEDEGPSSGSNSDSGVGTGGSHFFFGASGSGNSSGPSGMSFTGSGMGTQAGLGGKSTGNLMSLMDNDLVRPPAPRHKLGRQSVHLSSFPSRLDLHPSKIINKFLLRERPHAKMAITEDDDWISVLDKDDKVFPTPDILISRIMTMYEILDDNDVVSLSLRDLISRPLDTSIASSEIVPDLEGHQGPSSSHSGNFRPFTTIHLPNKEFELPRGGIACHHLDTVVKYLRLTCEYQPLPVTGPQHEPTYIVLCIVQGIEYGRGTGTSMKMAKESAAMYALSQLKLEFPAVASLFVTKGD